MGKLEGFNERRSEGSMFSTTFFNKIKEKVSALKENFLENEDLRPSQTLDAGVQGFKAGLQAIEEADREGLIGDHLTPEQKYAINQVAIQGDNVEPTVDEQGKLTLSVDGNPMTIDEINELGVKAIAPEKEKTTIMKIAKQEEIVGKQGEPFRRDEVFGSIKALVSKGDIDALLKNDITGTGTTPLEDISKNHPEFANLSYADLGIDPTGVDLNGDGIINEDEKALLSNNDREKIIKADPNILADYVTRKVAQFYARGKAYFDKENPKEDKPKMSADELIEKYSAMEDVAKDVGVTPDAAIDNLRDETRSALPLTSGTSSSPIKNIGGHSGAGIVRDSLRNIQSEKNRLEIFQPLEDKYNNLLDSLEEERNAKIDSLRNDLNVTRFEAGEFKTQGEYDDAYEKVESEVKKIKEEYRPKISQIQKDFDKEYYSNLPNIDNQIAPQMNKVYDNDVKRYKRGELTFEEMKERYPNIHPTDLK
jgi:hypothetical protein